MREESLEDAFARRDAAAFERAYERFGTLMYAAALRVLRNPSLAQECVHDVLLHLWQKGNAYTAERGRLDAFLVVCARNAALTRARNDARRRELLATAPLQLEPSTDRYPFEQEPVSRALSSLTAAQAKVVELAYYRGFTLAEIAQQLDEPVGTVKSRLSSALRGLRARLSEGGE